VVLVSRDTKRVSSRVFGLLSREQKALSTGDQILAQDAAGAWAFGISTFVVLSSLATLFTISKNSARRSDVLFLNCRNKSELDMPVAGIALKISCAVGNDKGGFSGGAGALGFGDAARLPPWGVTVGGDFTPEADTLSLMRFEFLLASDIAPPSL
jgi:hypothetical protein